MRTPIEQYFHALYPDPDWDSNPGMDGNIVVPVWKPVKELTDAELDAEIERLWNKGVRP